MKDWLSLALEAIKSIFGFAEQSSENKGQKIPFQEVAIREDANTDAVKELRKQDRIQDKDLLREPKILYHFDNVEDYLKSINLKDNERPLYHGEKAAILSEIKQDWARILTPRQQRQFKRLVKKSGKEWFCIKIHPLTVH